MFIGTGLGTGYPYWATCGIGSSVTTREAREIVPGMTAVTTTVLTLLAVEPTLVRVRLKVSSSAGGGAFPMATSENEQDLEIPARPPAAPEASYESSSEANADGTYGIVEVSAVPFPEPTEKDPLEEGEETLQVDGRPVACRWIRRGFDANGQRMTYKTWISSQVPGGLVRSEVRVDGDPPHEWTTEVVAFEKKPAP